MANKHPGKKVLTHTDKKWRVTDIVTVPIMWVVCFDGEPIKVVKYSGLTNGGVKYKLETFTSKTRADNEADRLNRQFHSKGFTARQFTLL
jgi:hypothetical protein